MRRIRVVELRSWITPQCAALLPTYPLGEPGQVPASRRQTPVCTMGRVTAGCPQTQPAQWLKAQGEGHSVRKYALEAGSALALLFTPDSIPSRSGCWAGPLSLAPSPRGWRCPQHPHPAAMQSPHHTPQGCLDSQVFSCFFFSLMFYCLFPFTHPDPCSGARAGSCPPLHVFARGMPSLGPSPWARAAILREKPSLPRASFWARLPSPGPVPIRHRQALLRRGSRPELPAVAVRQHGGLRPTAWC